MRPVARTLLALSATSLLTLAGCGFAGAMPLGGMGATQGGAQDMGLARTYVAQGTVPPPSAFVVEGMFSEHDLPLDGQPCTRTLCLRSALGLAPTLHGTPSGWMQVGLSSNVDPATFERPTLSVILTVDVSCSMGWGYKGADATPGELARDLMTRITGHLGANDRVAIVTYGSNVSTVLPFTTGGDGRIASAIRGLHEAGSTNMEAGLTRAYELASTASGTTETRVMLFTDERPNVGDTSATGFEGMVEAGANRNVGITVFGFGQGLGQDLFLAMSHLRGGNAFSIFDRDGVAKLMDQSWPWMVSPIAYGLHVAITPTPGYAVTSAYGFPGTDPALAAPSLDVATVFLSKNRGALLVQLGVTGTADLSTLGATGTIGYETPSGDIVKDQLDAALDGTQPLDARGDYFEQHSTDETVALALLVTGMKQAATEYGTDHATAVATMQAVDDRFHADADAIADPGLDVEVKLADDLLALMQKDAPQTDLYGSGG